MNNFVGRRQPRLDVLSSTVFDSPEPTAGGNRALYSHSPPVGMADQVRPQWVSVRTIGHDHNAVAGSLYLIGEAMELLHVAAAPGGDEKGLNEWTGRLNAERG